ncbi:hypothetical protein WUBG_07492 [Wuchereria bancrofti]|uniref:Uncharacterized protein n=1 Tax=Wuchereria bancrofti TaxID=6293 RepID=J9F2Q3_WUCBA|nr:hypothetical protein WUBG_07492 [Wuchereria bancrofti]
MKEMVLSLKKRDYLSKCREMLRILYDLHENRIVGYDHSIFHIPSKLFGRPEKFDNFISKRVYTMQFKCYHVDISICLSVSVKESDIIIIYQGSQRTTKSLNGDS